MLADWRPHDTLLLTLTRERSVYALSPLSVSREVIRRQTRLRGVWQPTPSYHVEGWLSTSSFSDDNSRRELFLAPRRNVLKTGPWALDLGVSAQWFGFSDDLANGYYDPAFFRRFAGTALLSWQPDVDTWLGLNLSSGWHEDDTMSGYRLGTDVSLEGVSGLYRLWELHGRLSYADRLQENGRYHGTAAVLELRRRF